jgi:epidermal growth factor receptor substrate 15
MTLSLAILTDEERLNKLRDEIRTLEKEKSAILSEASSQRKALGEIGRDMEENKAIAQSAKERLASLNIECESVTRIILSNRQEAEKIERLIEEREKLAKSLEGIAELVESKKGELEALKRSLAQEKTSLVAISREKEETIKEISRKTLAIEARETSIFTRETKAAELESTLNAYQERLRIERKDLELKKKRLKDYAETIGIKLTYTTDDGTTEK